MAKIKIRTDKVTRKEAFAKSLRLAQFQQNQFNGLNLCKVDVQKIVVLLKDVLQWER
jgi:hypothetical protein